MIKHPYTPYGYDYNSLVDLTNNFNYAMYSYDNFCGNDDSQKNHLPLNQSSISKNNSEYDYFHYPATKLY